MFVLARTMPGRRVHWRGAKPVRAAENARETMFTGVDRGSVVNALRSDGLYSGLVLPPSIHEEIARFSRETPCFGNFDRRLEFLPTDHAVAEDHFGRPLLSGHYFFRQRSLCCGSGPDMIEITAKHTSAPPTNVKGAYGRCRKWRRGAPAGP